MPEMARHQRPSAVGDVPADPSRWGGCPDINGSYITGRFLLTIDILHLAPKNNRAAHTAAREMGWTLHDLDIFPDHQH